VFASRRLLTLLVLSPLLGSCRDPFPRQPVPKVRFYQQGPYQTFYDPAGGLLRRLTDTDGDGVAERIELFHPNRRVRQLESDTDGDGHLDLWEVFRPDGELEKVGRSERHTGQPDLWVFPDGRGGLARREVDENGDGRIDRVEHLEGRTLVRVSLDGDGGGRFDRWQSWESFRLTAERFDTDGDGAPDRQLRFDGSGNVVAVEPYP